MRQSSAMASVVPIYGAFMLSDNISKFIYAHEAHTYITFMFISSKQIRSRRLRSLLESLMAIRAPDERNRRKRSKISSCIAYPNDLELTFYFPTLAATQTVVAILLVLIFLSVAFTTNLFALAFVPYRLNM